MTRSQTINKKLALVSKPFKGKLITRRKCL